MPNENPNEDQSEILQPFLGTRLLSLLNIRGWLLEFVSGSEKLVDDESRQSRMEQSASRRLESLSHDAPTPKSSLVIGYTLTRGLTNSSSHQIGFRFLQLSTYGECKVKEMIQEN